MQATPSVHIDTYASPYGRWQGVHWRRLCRCVAAGFLAILIAFSWLTNSPSAEQAIVGVLVAVIVFALSEWLFARRMGIKIQHDAITLCGPFRQSPIPWEDVQGLVWREGLSFSKTKYLYLETNHKYPRRLPKDAPIRIPTIAFSSESRLPNDRLLGGVLTSPDIRSTAGEEADAVKTIEQAWNIGREQGNGAK